MAGFAVKEGVGVLPAPTLRMAVNPLGFQVVAQANVAFVYTKGILVHEHHQARGGGIADGGEFLASLTHLVNDGAGARPGILTALVNYLAFD